MGDPLNYITLQNEYSNVNLKYLKIDLWSRFGVVRLMTDLPYIHVLLQFGCKAGIYHYHQIKNTRTL